MCERLNSRHVTSWPSQLTKYGVASSSFDAVLEPFFVHVSLSQYHGDLGAADAVQRHRLQQPDGVRPGGRRPGGFRRGRGTASGRRAGRRSPCGSSPRPAAVRSWRRPPARDSARRCSASDPARRLSATREPLPPRGRDGPAGSRVAGAPGRRQDFPARRTRRISTSSGRDANTPSRLVSAAFSSQLPGASRIAAPGRRTMPSSNTAGRSAAAAGTASMHTACTILRAASTEQTESASTRLVSRISNSHSPRNERNPEIQIARTIRRRAGPGPSAERGPWAAPPNRSLSRFRGRRQTIDGILGQQKMVRGLRVLAVCPDRALERRHRPGFLAQSHRRSARQVVADRDRAGTPRRPIAAPLSLGKIALPQVADTQVVPAQAFVTVAVQRFSASLDGARV